MTKKILLITLFILSIQTVINAQTKLHPYHVHLSEDGKQYIKFGINVQLWGRYSQLDPGSRVGSNIETETYDIVIRRLRMQAMGMLTEKVFFHLQLGTNNINFTNTGPTNVPVSVMDALGEYHFNKAFKVGGGLSGWGAGTTRYSAQSSSTQLSLDAPIYQQNSINSIFGNRSLSMYAKGEVGNFSYRAVVVNPYRQATSTLNDFSSSISTKTPAPEFIGMLTYQFLDKESNLEPYNKATYLGTKRVFNISAGIMHQSRAMWKLSPTVATDTTYSSMNVFGTDIFYDSPIGSKGAALTLYGAYNYCDYGQNYARLISTPNPASSGPGTGFYMIGTGNIFYGQIGYLFNKSKDENKKGRAQIYGTTQIAALKELKTPMVMFEAGVNYYLTGSFGPKVTLGYQNRGLFASQAGETQLVSTDRKGMLVMQFQVSF
jgi:hypothetical protein